jgi:hypothetical protein
LQKAGLEKLAAAPAPLAKAAEAAGLTPNRLPEALDRIASEIVSEPLENLVLLDGSGAELVRTVGTEDMVQLPATMLTQLADRKSVV